MVKFGRYLIAHTREDWKEQYINYNFLKKSIKTLWERQKNEKDSSIMSDPNKLIKPVKVDDVSLINEVDIHDPIEKILHSSVGKYVNEFLTMIDTEIKKFYKFFHKIEKDLYVEINSHLYMEENYKTFSLNHIFDELEKLEEMSKNTLSISDYVNLNVTAIRKILKKFDKKFKLKENPIALYYLRKNLKSNNSYLAYILQFKIIDESSAILEKLITSLEKTYSDKMLTFNPKDAIEDLLHEPLIMKEMNLTVMNEIDENKITSLVNSKFKRLKSLLEKIDDNNNLIRANLEIWTLIIKTNIRMIDDFYSKRKDVEEQILSKLTPQLKNVNHLQSENILNIWITLIHTFLYTTNCYIMQPTNNSYIKSMKSSPFLSGLIMGFAPLAALISTFFYSYWSNSSYKIPLIFSCVCFITGNFLYSIADSLSSLPMMGTGRFLIGLGGARVVNRRYLIDHVNQEQIQYYSFQYVMMTCLGMAGGPFFALILLHFPQQSYGVVSLNTHTYPGWFLFMIWILFFFIILTFFSDEVLTKVIVSDQADKDIPKPSNGKLEVINEEKEGESVSLVNKEIKELIENQKNAFSYMSVSFMVLIAVLFVARMYTECLLILAPITLPHDYNWSYVKIDIFFCLTALLVLPMCIIFDRFSKNYKERQLLIILLILSFTCCLLMLRHIWEISVLKYILFYTVLSLTTNILESVGSALIAKIFIGEEFSQIINSGFIIVIAVTGGRWLGSNLVTVFGYFDYDQIQEVTFSFFCVCFAILSLIVYFNYDKLRVKAIARIKKSTFISRLQFS